MIDQEKQSLLKEMEYLYQSLNRIADISSFDTAYELARAACTAYLENRKREKAHE